MIYLQDELLRILGTIKGGVDELSRLLLATRADDPLKTVAIRDGLLVEQNEVEPAKGRARYRKTRFKSEGTGDHPLKIIMIRDGLLQEQQAKKLGISKSALGYWIQGRGYMSPTQRDRLEKRMGAKLLLDITRWENDNVTAERRFNVD